MTSERSLDGPVLVTGAGGFVGRYLMKELELGRGDYATDVDDSFDAPEDVKKIAWKLPCEAPPEMGEVKYVVHLAAVSSVSAAERNVETAYRVNLEGTLSVLEYVAKRSPGARFLLVSSSEVYAPAPEPLNEEAAVAPARVYGRTKAAAESVAFTFAGVLGLDLVVARPFPHFGPGQSEHFALPSFCRRILEARRSGKKVIKVGNIAPVRDYTYVTDVVKAYRMILMKGVPGTVYNVCTGKGTSMEEMVGILGRVADIDLKLEVDPELYRDADVEFQVGDPSRMLTLGWKPEIDVEEGLKMLFSWKEART